MGEAVRLSIKAIVVPIEAVERVARPFESLRRCEITHEILGGGNCYVSVAYCWSVLNGAEKLILPDIAAIVPGGHAVICGIQVAAEATGHWELVELPTSDEAGRCLGYAYDPREVAAMVVRTAAAKGRWEPK